MGRQRDRQVPSERRTRTCKPPCLPDISFLKSNLYDEINYRRSEKLTKKMLAAGLITPDECDKILAEIRKIFVPILADIW